MVYRSHGSPHVVTDTVATSSSRCRLHPTPGLVFVKQVKGTNLDGVQVSGFSSFQKSVVDVGVPQRDVLYRTEHTEHPDRLRSVS